MSRRRRRDGTPPPRAVPRRLVVPRRPGWFVAVIGLLFLACLLVGNGLVHSEIGVDAHRQPLGGHDQVPASVLEGGPVLDGRRDPVRSFTPPPRTVALTFDDGPDPQWTPQVLDVLRRHGVRGTFMVVGSLVTRHPGLARDIGDSGSELGVHTFTHPDLRTSSDTRLREELSASQLALAGAAGITTYLMRPPYASGPSSLDDLGMRTVRAAGALGFVTVLSDVDSRDWATQDAETIVRHATPERDRGAVVLLHDAGGDRAQTVAALDRLIPRLKDRGYRITTVSDALGLPPANQPAQVSDRIRGLVVVAAVGVATTLVGAMAWLLLATGVLMIARLLLMILLARRHHRRRRDPGWSWGPPVTRPVSVVVPAYNERENIAEVVRALAASDHPAEVVVVDDGSTDGTGEIVSALGLPGVTVVRQPNQGKPAALNTGIAHARHDIVVLVDGDTIVEPSALRLLAQPFADPAVGAVSGNAKVANQRRLIGRWQCIEYVMGFNIDRRVYDTLGCMPTVPGAVGAFRREALEQVGGVSDDTLAEDTDLTIAVGRRGWRIVYEDGARAWTEAPTTWGQLWRQRYRWSYGTMQSIWKHRRAVFERGASGRFGRIGLPHLAVFQVLLPLLAPLVDIFLVYGLLFHRPWETVLGWSGVLLVQLLGAVYAFRLDRERLRLLWLLPLQQVVYRQLMYAVLLQSITTALAGVRMRWQKLDRHGVLPGDGSGPPRSPRPGPVPVDLD
ncbi:Glycosyltransferase, catalytic subunit of cellulose synthase and poly-beta-1,6-N-acetylglucosamine synthase [Streptoalloteichus tenebrarius]|uniref:Glycosyltransferase, catalytic subunit of cellulose synthase and poly-beta-1,6-N-acetylglucosamine synthase n=2 Tax=Actinomycetes TaxID=1760 RepID=A0ABT1HRR6_STRSD|nr:bifunctional polysaccharide deacetylase/glycosyltransferase family 2 protein [Streptoalloteichus tenebrarius]MCP2258209.1 Glycosyltransferase, catalytic subunit of cellulose synthase and poly-beta-1,6-N-acetylglucosamine synthase [Streptoalloteichus tenebrarius]